MSTSPTESVRSHHMDAKDARASTSATSSSSHLPSGLADASLSSRALSSDSPQTMKKKRLIISVGNSKIGSIYFGKKEKKNRKTQPHTISEVQTHYSTERASTSHSHSNSSYKTTTSTTSSGSLSYRGNKRSEKARKARESQHNSSSSLHHEPKHAPTHQQHRHESSHTNNHNAHATAAHMASKVMHLTVDREVTDTTEQSVYFSGLEMRSGEHGDGKDKDHARHKEIVSHFHSKLKSSPGLVGDLRRDEHHHASISTFALPDDAKQIITDHLRTVNMNPYNDFYDIIEGFKKQHKLISLLPAKLGTINLITNVPIDDDLINTPRTDVTPDDKASISELSLLLMSSVLHSCPYINEDEKSGTVIQNVIPIPGKEREISGSGSLLQFNWHTENVHEEHPAEFLMLLCLRGDKNAFTSFMMVEDIISGLDEQFLHSLLTTKFLMKTGPSYHNEKVCLRSILTHEKHGGYTVVYNSDMARCCPQDDHGKKLYLDFQSYLECSVPSYAISLEPGEAVIIKNREALHKRDGFVISTTDEERRWLQRVYLKSPHHLPHHGKPVK